MSKQTIQFSYPVESVNRKLTLRKNTASDSVRVGAGSARISISKTISRYMGAGVRRTRRQGVGDVYNNFLFVRFNKRGTQVTADEIANRNRFKFVVNWTWTSLKSLALVQSIRADFAEGNSKQGISPAGKTFYGFVFAVRTAQYDSGVTSTTDPAYNQWPTT